MKVTIADEAGLPFNVTLPVTGAVFGSGFVVSPPQPEKLARIPNTKQTRSIMSQPIETRKDRRRVPTANDLETRRRRPLVVRQVLILG